MSRCEKNPVADQVMHNSNLCVWPRMSLWRLARLGRKSFSTALKSWHKCCTCLSGALFTLLLLQTGYFRHFKNSPVVEKCYVLFVCVQACCSATLLFPSRVQHMLLWLPVHRIRAAWTIVGKLVGGDELMERGNRQGGWAVWHPATQKPRAIITTGNSVSVFWVLEQL